MAIRIDEYGHIIRDDEPAANGGVHTSNPISRGAAEPEPLHVPNNASSLQYYDQAQPGPLLEISVPWYGGSAIFWTITMAAACAVAFIAYARIAPMIFAPGEDSSDLLEAITNYLLGFAPYVLCIGAFAGSILYNVKGTKRAEISYHAAWEYLLSPLCAIAGVACAGALLGLIILAVYIVAGIIMVAIVIAIIVGLISGG